MGNQPSGQLNGQSQNDRHKMAQALKRSQAQVLAQAAKIVEQLQLYKNQIQYRDQRHLLARILLYGHSHLIAHMKSFPKQKQALIIHQLKAIDYETLDLLYENLVLKRMKNQRKKIEYREYNGYIQKYEQAQNNETRRNKQKIKLNIHYKKNKQLFHSRGQEVLKNKKGGISSSFKNEENNYVSKQFYKQRQDQKCLMQIMLDKLQYQKQQYPNLTIYIAYSQSIYPLLKPYLQSHPNLQIKRVFQNENPILNLSGKLCLLKQNSFQVITSPRGCGDLANLVVSGKGVKIFDDMNTEGVQFTVICGCENIFVQVVDQFMLGVLDHKDETGAVFKCTYPDNQNENLKRIVYNPTKKCLEATELQILLQNADKNSYSVIRRSPVWTNYTIFKNSKIHEYLSLKRNNLTTTQSLFIPKNILYTYWNPTTSSYYQNQHCFMFQQQIDSLLLSSELNSVGVMVQRQNQFLPIISIKQQKTWSDAYSQFMYKQSNKDKIRFSVNNLKFKVQQNQRFNNLSIQSALQNSEI